MTMLRMTRFGMVALTLALTLALTGVTTGCGGEKAVTAGTPSPAAASAANASGTGAAIAGSASAADQAIDIVSAKQVIGDLWEARQVEMSEEDENGFAAVESGPALLHDAASAIQVNCKASRRARSAGSTTCSSRRRASGRTRSSARSTRTP